MQNPNCIISVVKKERALLLRISFRALVSQIVLILFLRIFVASIQYIGFVEGTHLIVRFV